MAKRIVDVILNSGSGKLDKQPLVETIRATLASQGVDPRVHLVEGGPQLVAAAARAAAGNADVIVAAGGDGTIGTVSKQLVGAGQRHFGENRVQEAQGKWPALLAKYPDVILHGIGRLQSNKAAEAVTLFNVIHSLDRLSLLEALVRDSAKAGRFPSVYVQVNIGEEEQKGGCAIAELGDLLAAVRASPLPLAGLMAMPPLGVEPSPYFALFAKLADEHGVTGLSMGMSGDYKAAVMLGATAVRVGTALFQE